ncbi:MAG: hypothetical protein AVW06_04320 [Hadesarchaea archaeon DG-33-1]|nr:MAG: hypothetical protein AVW06_04320 [Hadesarchaea archaeon DG-33-1]
MSADRIIKFELSKLNVHLPVRRLSLREALSSPKPQVVARDGSVHTFKREELEFLAGLLPEADRDKLQLPILIALEPKLGRGTARISGEAEVKVVRQVLKKKPAAGELLIYRPEVAILRRKLPTTTQYLFSW